LKENQKEQSKITDTFAHCLLSAQKPPPNAINGIILKTWTSTDNAVRILSILKRLEKVGFPSSFPVPTLKFQFLMQDNFMAALCFPAVVSFHSPTLPLERKSYVVFNENGARMYVQNLNQCKSPSFCDTCCIL
jgi:hypothetical protein